MSHVSFGWEPSVRGLLAEDAVGFVTGSERASRRAAALRRLGALVPRLAARRRGVADPRPMPPRRLDTQVTFTEHMTEAAAVVGECHVVLDFPPDERATYAIKVYAALKGTGTEPYFAVLASTPTICGRLPAGRWRSHCPRRRYRRVSQAPACTIGAVSNRRVASAQLMVPVALTIAGSDPSGGAGLQADLKTFAAFGVYGASRRDGTHRAEHHAACGPSARRRPGVRCEQQLDAVLDDLAVGAAKTGMLARGAVVEVVAAHLRARPLPHLVVDPVLVATSGDALLEPSAIAHLRDRLLPLATLVTPNLHEAAVLTGRPVAVAEDMRAAARALVGLGARAALVKGGHLTSGPALDVLYDGHEVHELAATRVPTPRPIHGAGCALSAAITAGLARGLTLQAAVTAAKRWVTRALETAVAVGHGALPPNHLVRPTE